MAQPSQSTSPTGACAASDAGQRCDGVLRVEQLTFGYRPDTPVIEALNAELLPGRVTALIGPNATGKTTLLRLMLGQLKPQHGRVLLEGRDVWRLAPGRRARQMSYVPQRPSVAFGYTVREVVALGRHTQDRTPDALPDEQAVEQALHQCGLLEVADRTFNELSGGQQQRVTVARAFAQSEVGRPGAGRVMLLDEPCASADPRHAHDLLSRLRAAAREGRAVLVVLHDLNLAARWADEVWLMDRGLVVANGPWQQVLRPQTLDPVYRLSFTMMSIPGADRPIFHHALPAGELGDRMVERESPL